MTGDDLPVELFPSQADWEAWLEEHHAAAPEVWVKFAKKGSGVQSVSYGEAVESALCFGWIDGQMKSLDERFYLQRFTPRRARSPWSQLNRAKVEELIAAGRVRVNGRRARLGQRVVIAKDEVEVDGSRVPIAPELRYYLVNKPVGTVTTARDPQGRPTVMDLIGEEARLWPVGRLDADSEGALVVTNDGGLTEALTHPRFEVEKTYVATVAGHLRRGALKELQRGIALEDGVARARRARVVGETGDSTMVEVVMTEGRKREVRRMLAAVGHPVKRLVRVAVGPVRLGRLKPGTYRKLTPDEVRALYRAAGG